jgi:heptosyltransferase-3
MKPEPLACLIASRNLGDIVIWSSVLRELAAARYAERFVVWTRPQMAWMFEDVPNCEVVCSSFPVGTRKEFGARAALQFLRVAARIRVLEPSVFFDFVGDFRERWFARLAGSRRHLQIGWEAGHPYTRLIRNPFGRGHPLVTVPTSVPNVYAAYELMVAALAGRADASRRTKLRDRSQPVHHASRYRVGLHPFASQPCKLWTDVNWASVARELLGRGFEVLAFSAPGERESLRGVFAGLEDRVSLVTGTLSEFAATIATLDVMVGLDSFSVHMAHRQGVPSITINAGAPAELWAIPSGRILAESGGCSHYPCYNVAPCRGTSYQNACVNAVTPAQVLAAIESARRQPPTGLFPEHVAAGLSGGP